MYLYIYWNLYGLQKLLNCVIWVGRMRVEPKIIIHSSYTICKTKKSTNMSYIIVYLAMFSTTIDTSLCFWSLIRLKWVIILLVFGTLWNLGLFWFPKTPPPNFELFPTESWDFWIFWPFPKFPRFLVWKASLTLSIQEIILIAKIHYPKSSCKNVI